MLLGLALESKGAAGGQAAHVVSAIAAWTCSVLTALALASAVAMSAWCAGNWLAFFIIQLITFFRWQRESWWLVLVAGCRFGDCLTDITWVVCCDSISVFGLMSYPVAGATNVVLGVVLMRYYQALSRPPEGRTANQ